MARVLWAAVDLQRLARQREERLALVEYELRVAQEDRSELQVSLTWPSSCPTPPFPPPLRPGTQAELGKAFSHYAHILRQEPFNHDCACCIRCMQAGFPSPSLYVCTQSSILQHRLGSRGVSATGRMRFCQARESSRQAPHVQAAAALP